MSSQDRIGLFGGSFNPVHLGHLILAQEAIEYLSLNKMIWIPAGDPPHKKEGMLDKYERVRLLREAIADNPKFELSTWEVDRQEPSFTLSTLKFFQSEYPNEELCFIMGEDSLCNFHLWYAYRDLLKLASFFVAKRKQNEKESCAKILNHLRNLGGRIEFIPNPYMEISSTEIRKRISQKKSIRYFVPKEVEKMIRERGYYA